MADTPTVDVAANLAAVRAHIAAAAIAAGRAGDAVTLVAVSKTHPAEHIVPVLAAGQRVFGENRVQEAHGKWPGLREAYADVTLHLIGPLQTNKAREAVSLFDVIETVDRPKLAKAIRREMDHLGREPVCYVQVNTGAEPQKAGVLPDDADALIETCRETHRLPVKGLMCLPPHGDDPAPHFDLLARIAERNALAVLSMGMTADFEVAVAHGATHVRVGTAIFGPRGERHP
jgi:PLP dependent protein